MRNLHGTTEDFWNLLPSKDSSALQSTHLTFNMHINPNQQSTWLRA